MRILLAHNSLYYPSYGGGDKSNRLLMEALAARGHEVLVVARVEDFGNTSHTRLLEELAARGVAPREENAARIQFSLNGVEVRVLTGEPFLRAYFTAQIEAFDPDVILTSTDDAAHLMLQRALHATRARVVYLIRATVVLPFGPDSSMRSDARTAALRKVDGVVAVSEYVARYAREWGNLDAVHVPISLLEPREYLSSGRIDNRFVTMVNPCGVKGLSIFLGLAEEMPGVKFAAVPTWGTTGADLTALRKHPNITVLGPVDDIDEVFRHTRVALVPSLWAEARSRIILEAMVRGIPVLSSNVGGLAEAMLGMDYLLPINPVVQYQAAMDELMVPVAEIPRQDIGPWRATLERLINDPAHYEALSTRCRRAALAYAHNLNAVPFEEYLKQMVQLPKRSVLEDRAAITVPAGDELSPEKRRLLAQRLRRRSE